MKKQESIKAGKEKALGAIGEFKKFISQGNVMDMAVGVIMGGAFGKIVTSLVNDILMPLIGLLLGKVDFSELSIHGIKYGAFIQSIVDFLIVAVCIFAMVKVLEKFKRKEEVKDEAESRAEELVLLEEIRDAIKESKKK